MSETSSDAVRVGTRVEMRGPYGQPWRPATVVWVGSEMPGGCQRAITVEADDGARLSTILPHSDLRAAS